MTREEIIQWYEDELARLRQAPHLNGCDMTPEWAQQIEVHTAAVAALREQDILFEQVRGYCHTCKKNKTDFDCHAKCYGHQRGSAWEWDGGQRLEEV